MKIAVVSDSHGETENLRKAFFKSVEDHGVEAFLHLGDDYDDMEDIETGRIEITRVPGIYSIYYSSEKPENRIIRDFGGWRFLLSHTPDANKKDLPTDMDPRETSEFGEVDVLLHGHTHRPKIVQEPGYIRINPGNLKDNDDRYSHPTFCIIDVLPDTLNVMIYLLNNQHTLCERTFRKE